MKMGRTLLVIGGSSDIGMETIRQMHMDYDKVIVHYNHMNANLETLESELGERMVCMQADLSDEQQTRDLVENIKGMDVVPSHILHLPAPWCYNQKFHKIEWGVFQNEMDISLRSLVYVSQTFLPIMSRRKYGRLVVMLSFVVNGMPPGYCTNYVVTKYALLGLVKSLATEYADKGITVNGISPSWVMTKYISNQPEILIEQNAQRSPLGRNLEVDDIVPTIKYLFSDGAACVNGENISITCGR